MTAKEELHQLVEQLEDERADEVLNYVRGVVDQDKVELESAIARLNRRLGSGVMSGQEFFANHGPIDFETLARRQGVRPVERFEDLLGDFWPEDEKGEDFDEWLRCIRRD